jgi:multisubunit Na+/H+ antiporter MnhC subunit
MVYLIAAIAGLLASVISIFLFVTAMAARYRRQGFSQGEVGINIVSPVPLAIVITAFAAGFYAVLRISN